MFVNIRFAVSCIKIEGLSCCPLLGLDGTLCDDMSAVVAVGNAVRLLTVVSSRGLVPVTCPRERKRCIADAHSRTGREVVEIELFGYNCHAVYPCNKMLIVRVHDDNVIAYDYFLCPTVYQVSI